MKAKLSALDVKFQIIGVLALVGVLGYVAHMFVVSPKTAQVAKIQSQIDDEQTQIYRQRAILKSGQHPPTIQTADLFRLARAMPDREDMPGIILTLSQVAQAAGIRFEAIEPVLDSTAAAGPYATKRVHLEFHGDFYGLSDFLFRLRSLVAVHDGTLRADGRLFNVDTAALKMDPEKFPVIDAELFLQTYVYSNAAAAAAAGTTAPLTTPDTGATPTTTTSADGGGAPPTTPPETSPTGATALGAN